MTISSKFFFSVITELSLVQELFRSKYFFKKHVQERVQRCATAPEKAKQSFRHNKENKVRDESIDDGTPNSGNIIEPDDNEF